MKPITKAYLIAIFGTLIPSWIGSAIFGNDDLNHGFISLKNVIALCFYALAFWGTSFAFLVFNKRRYTLISGFGKWFLLLAGFFISYLMESNGHPYLLVIGLLLALCWCLFDLFYLSVNRNALTN